MTDPAKKTCGRCGQDVILLTSKDTGKRYYSNSSDPADWHSKTCTGVKEKKKPELPPLPPPQEYEVSSIGGIPVDSAKKVSYLDENLYTSTLTPADQIKTTAFTVKKITLEREDGQWTSKEDSDKHYGAGKSKSEGRSKKVKSGMEVDCNTSDGQTLHTIMEEISSQLRIKNQRELEL